MAIIERTRASSAGAAVTIDREGILFSGSLLIRG
jgi:hypothetical protein